MEVEYKEGLLFTTIGISFQGKLKIINNIVIDTGAAESIISPDVVEDIGIFAEQGDSINSFYAVGGSLHNYYTKQVQEVSLGRIGLRDVQMDFGVIDPKGNINGLLGLDLLMKIGAVIDLKRLSIMVDSEE
jgi:predicted aspartyl protease